MRYGSGSGASQQVYISCPEPRRMADSEKKCKVVRMVRVGMENNLTDEVIQIRDTSALFCKQL